MTWHSVMMCNTIGLSALTYPPEIGGDGIVGSNILKHSVKSIKSISYQQQPLTSSLLHIYIS